MQRLLVLAVVSACGGGSSNAVPPKPPNDSLIVDTFERRPPVGTTAMRFRANGEVTVAKDKGKLDDKPEATGTWAVDKDQLTLTYTSGECSDAQVGVYKVVLSKIGIHFTKVDDRCEQRSHIDGQTWWRIK